MVTPEVVNRLEEDLKSAGKSVEFTSYPGTDHAFFNDTRPEVYNETAAQDSWNRMTGFFRRTLT